MAFTSAEIAALTGLVVELAGIVCAYADDPVGDCLFKPDGVPNRMRELCGAGTLAEVKAFADACLTDLRRLAEPGAHAAEPDTAPDTESQLRAVLEVTDAARSACQAGRADTLAWLVARFRLSACAPWMARACGSAGWPLVREAWATAGFVPPALMNVAADAAINAGRAEALEWLV